MAAVAVGRGGVAAFCLQKSITINVLQGCIPQALQVVELPRSGPRMRRKHGIFGVSRCSNRAHFFKKMGMASSVQFVQPHKGERTQGRDANIFASIKDLSNEDYDTEHSRLCIVLDIEGTTTPISFVTDVLFPYARENVGKHLELTYDSEETQEDIKLLRAQVQDDLAHGVAGSVPIPPDNGEKNEVIKCLVTNVEAMIRADRKVTALKELQGHIWRTGFQNKELQAVVFDDVPEALRKWHGSGIKVYIFSSGSREAQKNIFGNSTHGDLRKYLCGFFDTMIGNKREPRSYFEISLSLGVDKPSQILFITDVYQEAVAAQAAGLEVIISVRPGNGPLPENHGFKTITSFAEI